ncbi:hypothetical protein [Bordetella sp. 02P26C-1]|uniref:hypothetical protein n=1 Tax=Bordetella sp. 02P26C-1 TaxID=2683195 RepID=UPI0013659CBF|nr:hypothetical protein [Bordetella sp. 02P26C-1]
MAADRPPVCCQDKIGHQSARHRAFLQHCDYRAGLGQGPGSAYTNNAAPMMATSTRSGKGFAMNEQKNEIRMWPYAAA